MQGIAHRLKRVVPQRRSRPLSGGARQHRSSPFGEQKTRAWTPLGPINLQSSRNSTKTNRAKSRDPRYPSFSLLSFFLSPPSSFSPPPRREIYPSIYKRAPITQKVQLRGVRFQLGDYGRNKFAWFLRRMELTGEENLPRSSRFFTANREREREGARYSETRLLIGTID